MGISWRVVRLVAESEVTVNDEWLIPEGVNHSPLKNAYLKRKIPPN